MVALNRRCFELGKEQPLERLERWQLELSRRPVEWARTVVRLLPPTAPPEWPRPERLLTLADRTHLAVQSRRLAPVVRAAARLDVEFQPLELVAQAQQAHLNPESQPFLTEQLSAQIEEKPVDRRTALQKTVKKNRKPSSRSACCSG